MSVLDDITNLQQQGYSEDQIIQTLQERGLSPREIKDALDQSKVKTAVNEEMSESMLTKQSQQYQEQPAYSQEQQMTQEQMRQYQQAQQQSPEYQPSYSSENVSEIAEGIVAEKINEIKKQISTILNLKGMLQGQITNIDDRLKRIESTIDKLQMEIISKIIGYGKSIQDINKEMQLMQDSFSKTIPGKRKQEKPAERAAQATAKKSRKDNFEHYIRE